MSNIYKDQARDLANIPILRRDVIACVLMNDLPPQTYWQIKKVASDIATII